MEYIHQTAKFKQIIKHCQNPVRSWKNNLFRLTLSLAEILLIALIKTYHYLKHSV